MLNSILEQLPRNQAHISSHTGGKEYESDGNIPTGSVGD